MLIKITHLTLFVNNQEKALAFYQKLGFIVHTDAQFGPMRWLTLHLPNDKNFELVLMLAEDDFEKALVGKQGGNKPFFSLETDDCKGDYERLKNAGVTFVQEPKDEQWGTSTACLDSEGNAIYIVQSQTKMLE
jgi:predicted enzyme related to lactoylglutathione lyase